MKIKIRGMIMWSKKVFIIIIVFVILILFVWLYVCPISPVCSNPPCTIDSNKRIKFFIATDPHYLSKDLTDRGKAYRNFIMAGDGKQLNYIEEIMDAFIYDIKNQKPNVLIISGDLTNNGERESHLDFSEKLKIIQDSGTSVYVIPGNHDIKNPWAVKFKGKKKHKVKTISDKDFAKIYGDFGYNDAISRDENSLSYLAAPSKDLWLLMMDTNQYENNMTFNRPQHDGLICPGTLQWIKECSDLAKEKNAQVIAVMHHSLLDHSQVVNEGYTLNNNKDAIEIFKNCGIELVLTGHIHLQSIKSYKEKNISIYDVATSALCVYPHKYGIIEYCPKRGYDYSTAWIDMEGWASKNNINDKNINNFKEYSKKFFENRSYYKFYDDLYDIHEYTDKDMRLMSEILAKLNLKYFEGSGNINVKEVRKSPGYKLVKSIGPDFLKEYMESILDNQNIDNNKLHIPIKNN